MREAMNKVDMPTDAAEKPLWEGDEDEMARLLWSEVALRLSPTFAW